MDLHESARDRGRGANGHNVVLLQTPEPRRRSTNRSSFPSVFSLGRHHPPPHVSVAGFDATQPSQVVLSLADLLRQFDTGNHHACVLEGFEPEHRVHPPPHASVVLLDDIIEVSAFLWAVPLPRRRRATGTALPTSCS